MSGFNTVDQGRSTPADEGPFDILIVDDDASIRGLLGEMLGESGEGYNVRFARSASAAATYIGRAAMVLSDLEMPLGGGDVVAQHMRTYAEAQKDNDPGAFVLMTANKVRADRLRNGDEALAHPFDGILDKPFNLDMLLTIVEQQLKARRPKE
jgi:CheY-like chemotaxis protein